MMMRVRRGEMMIIYDVNDDTIHNNENIPAPSMIMMIMMIMIIHLVLYHP